MTARIIYLNSTRGQEERVVNFKNEFIKISSPALSMCLPATRAESTEVLNIAAKGLSAELGLFEFLVTGKIPGRRKGTDKDSRHFKGVYRVRVVMPE
ncbi:MAG: hypothetical protein ABSH41_21370 [Syntrophobacteraceae bacterium]|jgi:hypothetical protein